MDDFDHSIHIAENDWSSFYDESEECGLLQPSLACLDDSDLSDSGDPDQQETQRRPDANSCTKLPEQLNQSGTQGSEEDAAISTKQGEICAHGPGENATTKEVGQINIEQETAEEARGNTNALQKEPQHDRSSDETKTLTEDGGVQSVSDFRPAKEPGLLYNQTELSVSEPDTMKAAEKERWFVTVNENLARRRGRSTTGEKKAHEGGLNGIVGRPKCSDGAKLNDKQESEKKRKIQSNQSIELGKNLSDYMKVDLVHTVKSFNQVLEDDAESLPVHSSDSEGCLSAAESVQEAQHPLQENLHFHCSLSLTCDGVTENTGRNRTHSRQMSSQSTAAANCERYERTAAELSVTSPPCQKASEMPYVSSPCENDTHVETSEPLTVENKGSASASSQEDQLSRIPAPNLPLTACSMADSPETYAKAAGQIKPVYAISAFWDEMEKLTINNILQVKKRNCLSSKPVQFNSVYLYSAKSQPKSSQDTVQEKTMPNPTKHSPLVDAVECNVSDCSLLGTCDSPDSDYVTEPDESQSDHCSKLLTSDFDEYWNFVGVSRNPNTDPHCKNQPSPSSSLLHRDNCTSSEGTETLVLLEDNWETHILTSWPRQITVQAFETEGLSLLPFLDDRSGLSLRCWCLEENTALKPNYSLEALSPASFLSHTDLLDAHDPIFSPEIIEYYFTESEASSESGSFVVYDPEETFAALDFNSTLGTFVDDAASFSLQTSEEPIPIFSCSHPPIRELTFPKEHCVFLRANSEKEDELSPFRFVSHSLIRADPHAAAAAVSGYHRWRRSRWMRKIHFPNKGGFCCRGSGVWMFQAESEEAQSRREHPTVRALSEGKITPDSSQVFMEERQESVWRTERDGLFSTVKQSDMCLVCIAFATWVLRSSDPEAADAWKAALLANVSALSAIQYLRQYVMKRSPPQAEL